MTPSTLRSSSRLLIGALLPTLLGCSQASHAEDPCRVQLSGNVSDSANLPSSCSTLGFSADAGAAGGYVLNLEASTPKITSLTFSVRLGATPAAGLVSSEGVGDWSAAAVSRSNSRCLFSAGNRAVPSGSFTLTLSSVEGVDGGEAAAHGRLDLSMYLHATPLYDCGAGNTEEVVFAF